MSNLEHNAESDRGADLLDWATVEWYYDHHGTLDEFCDWLEVQVRDRMAQAWDGCVDDHTGRTPDDWPSNPYTCPTTPAVVLDLDDPIYHGQTLPDALSEYDHVHSATGVCVKNAHGPVCPTPPE